MQSMIQDSNGITYALLHIVIGLIAVGSVWIICGVIVDEFNFISNDLVEQNDLWGENTQNSLIDLNKLYRLVLWVLVIASLFYGVLTAIRKDRGGING